MDDVDDKSVGCRAGLASAAIEESEVVMSLELDADAEADADVDADADGAIAPEFSAERRSGKDAGEVKQAAVLSSEDSILCCLERNPRSPTNITSSSSSSSSVSSRLEVTRDSSPFAASEPLPVFLPKVALLFLFKSLLCLSSPMGHPSP